VRAAAARRRAGLSRRPGSAARANCQREAARAYFLGSNASDAEFMQ
jgi:hypothetical protein